MNRCKFKHGDKIRLLEHIVFDHTVGQIYEFVKTCKGTSSPFMLIRQLDNHESFWHDLTEEKFELVEDKSNVR